MMSDENGGGFRGGFGGGGFLGRQSGVSETKPVTDATEVRIPLKQVFWLWMIGWGGFFFLYIALRQWLISRDDWLTFMGVLSIVAIMPVIIRYGRVIRKLWPFQYDRDGNLIRSDWLGIAIFITLGIIAFVCIQFYVFNVVPVIVSVLLNETETITTWEQLGVAMRNLVTLLPTLGLFGGLVPLWAGTVFFVQQLTKNLEVSDWHYAGVVAQIDWAREQYYDRKQPLALPEPETDNRTTIVATAPKKLISPRERFRLSMIDFLEGVQSEEWDTIEDTWQKQRLPRSQVPLTRSRGYDIRNELIRMGHANWVDPDNHHEGWELLYAIPVIIEALERYEGQRTEQVVSARNESGNVDAVIIGEANGEDGDESN